jgi:hypothetical protein
MRDGMDMFATAVVWATCGGAIGFFVGGYCTDSTIQRRHRVFFAIYGAILGWFTGAVYLMMP